MWYGCADHGGKISRAHGLSPACVKIEHMFDLLAFSEIDQHADEAALIERIADLERVKAAAAAGQARAAAALDERRRADESAAGVPSRQRGRGVASEIALARRDSPARGGGAGGVRRAALVCAGGHCVALRLW